MSAHRNAVTSGLFWLASIMFFLSGGTGLAYQVIWFKRFAHVWGSSSLAFASVGASFLCGLGLGAYLIGRFADRLERPLRWYGIAEVAIGALALIIPFQIAWLIDASAQFYSQLPEAPLWRYLVQFAVTLLVVGPPTILMGGTLPLLIRQLTAKDGSIDQATGWLYAINTFGAAFGCYFTGFVLLPAVGLYWTNIACASLNIAIGLVSIAFSAQPIVRRAVQPAKALIEPETTGGFSFKLLGLYVAVALSGLGALVLEMTWSRQLALVLGGSTYAYSSTLFVVLLGIAVGSLVFHFLLRPVASSPWVTFSVIMALVLTCLVGKLMLPQLAEMMVDYQKSRNTLLGNGAVCVFASMLLEFVPAVAMGILFPLFVHLTQESAARVGRAVGDVYAWNTFGSIFGASMTAVLLFPLIGTAGSLALAASAYLLALLLVLPLSQPIGLGLAAATLFVGGTSIAMIRQPGDPLLTNMGMYMYGNQRDRLHDIEQLYFAEGASSNVLVVNTNNSTSLRVNGKVDASDGLDMQTQIGLAYFPRMFNPRAKDVLVIGFGSGTTSGVSLLFPETRVTCCEIEPAVYGAAEHFAHINHKPYEKTRQFLRAERQKQFSDVHRLSASDLESIDRDARFQMVFGDGRSTLQGSDKKYDLIISEPSNPWLAGVSNLFTEEFFDAAHKHLNEGGVLAQWIQTYSFTWNDYLMIVRTLKTRFKHCGVVVIANGADTILLASDKPLLPTQDDLQEMQRLVNGSPAIAADLTKWYGTSDVAMLLMRFYKSDEELLLAKVAEHPNQVINSDLNLRLEFDAPLHLYEKLPNEDSAQVQILTVTSPEWARRLGQAVGIEPDTAQFQVALAEQALNLKNDAAALALYQKAIALDDKLTPAYIGIAQIHLRKKKTDAAVALLRDLARRKPDDVEALRALARSLGAANQPQEAMESWKKVLEREPSNTEGLFELAKLQLSKNLHADAIETLNRVIEIDPNNVTAVSTLGNEHMLLKQNGEAVKQFRRALELRPLEKGGKDINPAIWANNVAWILSTSPDANLRDGKEALRWAKAACEATNYQPQFVDTLAAAYAENGEFDEAVKFAQQFLDQSTHVDASEVQRAKDRLKLYQSRQPYRET